MIKVNKYTDDNDNVDTQNLNMDIERVERMRQKYEPSAFKQATFFSAVAGGTALNGSDIWRVASQVAGDDDLLLSTLVGQGKSLAMNGGRADQGGGSFTETLNIAKGYRSANKRGGHAAMDSYSEEADRALAATVLDNQGASVLSHPSMKPRMFNILLPEINRRLAVANESGDQDLIDREYAKVANLYDHIASNSNINAARFADEVLRVDPNAPPGQQLLKPGVAGPVQPGAKTTLDRINERRGSSVFQSTRRELSAQEDEARRNSGQSGTINPGSGPTMTPPSSYDE